MTITGISENRKNLSSIYIDGEFALKLSTTTVAEYRMQVGQEITDEELHEIIKSSDQRRAKDKALNLLSYGDRTKKELFDKVKACSDEESAAIAIERMEELGLIDDEKYARRYAGDLYSLKGLSQSAVKYKLLEKGIERDIADEISRELAPDIDVQLSELLDRKYYRNMFDEKGRKKTVSALQRAGFKWNDIKRAFNNFDNEHECEYPD